MITYSAKGASDSEGVPVQLFCKDRIPLPRSDCLVVWAEPSESGKSGIAPLLFAAFTAASECLLALTTALSTACVASGSAVQSGLQHDRTSLRSKSIQTLLDLGGQWQFSRQL